MDTNKNINLPKKNKKGIGGLLMAILFISGSILWLSSQVDDVDNRTKEELHNEDKIIELMLQPEYRGIQVKIIKHDYYEPKNEELIDVVVPNDNDNFAKTVDFLIELYSNKRVFIVAWESEQAIMTSDTDKILYKYKFDEDNSAPMKKDKNQKWHSLYEEPDCCNL